MYHGTLAAWYHGTAIPWYHSTMVPWYHRYHGTVVPWFHGTMVPWYNGTMVPWYHGTMVPWCHGAMVPWYHGVMVWYHGDCRGVQMSGRLGRGVPMSGARRADAWGAACRCLGHGVPMSARLGDATATRLCQPGTRQFQLVPAGTSWYQLGTSWYQLVAGYELVPAGYQLVPAGYQLVRAGISWHQLVLAEDRAGNGWNGHFTVSRWWQGQPEKPLRRKNYKAMQCIPKYCQVDSGSRINRSEHSSE